MDSLDALSKILLSLIVMLGLVVPVLIGLIMLVIKMSNDTQNRHDEAQTAYLEQFKRYNDQLELASNERKESRIETVKAITDQTEVIDAGNVIIDKLATQTGLTGSQLAHIADQFATMHADYLATIEALKSSFFTQLQATEAEIGNKIAPIVESQARIEQVLAVLPTRVWENPVAIALIATLNERVAQLRADLDALIRLVNPPDLASAPVDGTTVVTTTTTTTPADAPPKGEDAELSQI